MTKEVEFIESYIKNGTGDYKWNGNHGELVRCKDCLKNMMCELTLNKPKNWFCADGKRAKDQLSSMYGIQEGLNNG